MINKDSESESERGLIYIKLNYYYKKQNTDNKYIYVKKKFL